MRKFTMIFVAAFTCIALGLVVLMICMINGHVNVGSFEDGNLKLVNTQNISLDNINSINITYYSDDIKFYASDSDELVLKEYGRDSDEDKLAEINTNGDELSINGKRHNGLHFVFFGFSNNRRAEIYLPEKYAGSLRTSTSSGEISSKLVLKLKTLELSCSSGDIYMNEAYADEINVSTSSGEITFQKAEGKRNFTSTSGDIKVNSGSGDSSFEASSGEIIIKKAAGQLTATASSGDIYISDSEGPKNIETSSGEITVTNSSGVIKASASSGDIRITANDGGGDIGTTSGEINYELNEVTDNINIEASSGDVSLKIPEATNFNFEADTSSGDIRTFFDDSLSYNRKGNHASGAVGEKTDRTIQISTTSGEVNVSRN